MSLHLDLRGSTAKVDGAVVHLDALKAQTAELGQHDPITVSVGRVDPETGHMPIYLRLNVVEEVTGAVTVGDLMHNLRCALDYIITALVAASDAELSQRHQFPIFLRAEDFHRKVLTQDLLVREVRCWPG